MTNTPTKANEPAMSNSQAPGAAGMTDVVIVGGARTPQGRLNGQLAPFTAVDLGAFAIAGALDKAGVPAVSPLVVAFKSELEKLREQIQNVE